ncbi:MAG: LacI family DNA-binding transcriptional regulator [Cellulosilyticaceae bacterium]
MNKAGINDIANELGISRNTVSKVMNNRGTVSEKVRYKIIDTAVKLKYDKLPTELLEEYDEMKVALDTSKNQSKNILVIATSPDFSSFWAKMIKGITQKLVEKDYKCLYNFITFEEVDNFELPHIIETGDIAGIIVINVYNKETVKKITKVQLPTVYFDMPLDLEMADIGADIVVIEGRRSIYQITKTLIEQKDRLLGFIGDIGYCKSIQERWRGFVKAHNEIGVPIDNEYCFIGAKKGHYYFEKEVEGIVESMHKEGRKLPKAFVCANDAIAYSLINELEKRGYKVPEDVRVSGFDDMESDKMGEKYLTTVGVDIQQVGERLAEQMVWRVNNPEKHFEEIKILGDIIYRQSTRK